MAKKRIKFAKPKRTEVFLLITLSIILFFIDVNNNKLIDKGLDYKTTWFFDYQTSALSNFWVGIFIYVALYVVLIAYAIKRRNTHFNYDITFGTIAIFALSFIIGGLMLELFAPFAPFLVTLNTISFYHIGIGLSIIVLVYFAITD